MIIKYREASGVDHVFKSNGELPIMVVFEPGELEQVKNMSAGCTRYCLYSSDMMTPEHAKLWMRDTSGDVKSPQCKAMVTSPPTWERRSCRGRGVKDGYCWVHKRYRKGEK